MIEVITKIECDWCKVKFSYVNFEFVEALKKDSWEVTWQNNNYKQVLCAACAKGSIIP